jgi:hypothetical protein
MAEVIKIGAISYAVVEIEGLHTEGEKLDGHIKYGPCEIRLEATQSPQAKRQVLWHEILHAILTHAGYRKHDDGRIDALAYGIMSILQDNPHLRQNDG